MIKAAVLTVSDSRTQEDDASGKIILDSLDKTVFDVRDYTVVRDDREQIVSRLLHHADTLAVDLVLTTGGTGFGPRDVTPEATQQVIDRRAPGISELIRLEGYKETDRAFLSRGCAGIRKSTLIINLPGSPRGVAEALEVVLRIIPHAVAMLRGEGH